MRYIETRDVPVGDLLGFPGNARLHAADVLEESARTNGQYRSIVARRRGDALEILAGHGTRAAFASIGTETVRVEVIDCDDDEAARIVLVDNRGNDLASYDDTALLELLRDVPDLVGTGFDQDLLDQLESEMYRAEKQPDPDEAPPVPTSTPRTRTGDLWLLGRHRLLCGDSTDPERVTRLMNGERAVMMATDPPYLVDYDGSNHPQSTVNSAMTKDKNWDDYKDPKTGLAFYVDFIGAALEAALIETPVIYQWHADLRRALVVDAWEHHGLLPHQIIIWIKSRPVLTRSDFMWQHEPCMYGWRRGDRPPTERRPPANGSTVWHIDQRSTNDIHPTQKPVEIFAGPIEWHSGEGEVVYEPFSGSGTQIVAAELARRRCYAMEVAPQYVDVACRRFQEQTGVVPILEATGEPVDFGDG